MRVHTNGATLLLAASLVIANLSLASPASAEPITLRYGQAYSASRSIFALPVAVAEREGFFSREGLDLKVLIPVPGGADRQIEALHNGSVDLTHVATPFLVRAALNGSDAVAIAAEFDNPIYTLVAKAGIKSFADVKGRVVGLADEAGTITLSIRRLMAMHGLARGEFAVRTIEGTSARLGCLRRGDCDAVVLGQPQDLQAVQQGYRALGYSTEAVPQLLYTVTAVRRSFAQANPDAMLRYVRALGASLRFIRDPANRDSVAKIITATTHVSDDISRATLALFFAPERGVLPRQAEIDLKGLAQVITLMGEGGLLKTPLPAAERFVDLQYLRAAGLQ
jgi:ABC-type nitrate/sulfonate/bicarbonate transport system substrate-binding protein